MANNGFYVLRALTSWNWDSANIVAIVLFATLVWTLSRRRQRWATLATLAVVIAYIVWFVQFDWA